MADQVLAEERYSHVLFHREGKYFLTYLSGGPVEVDRTVMLPPNIAVNLTSSAAPVAALVRRLLAGSIPEGVVQMSSPIWPAP